MMIVDPWLLSRIVCPRDYEALSFDGVLLRCGAGHCYPVIDGVPIMLLEDVEQTIGLARKSLDAVNSAGVSSNGSPLFLDTVGVSADERDGIRQLWEETDHGIDPVVAYLVAATNGNMYKHLIGQLSSYPIPRIPVPPGDGRTLLDIGCSWGRWSVAASRKGYVAVGLDPSIGAIMAARRVSRALGLSIRYLVADARHLPFRQDSFDCVFSYSVVQHFSVAAAEEVAAEVGRVVRRGGSSVLQFAGKNGLRCLFHQARRRFRRPTGFEVRYWSVSALVRLFSAAVGPTSCTVDCFFGIGLQEADAGMMPLHKRALLRLSSGLRRASLVIPAMIYVADSVYVQSVKVGAYPDDGPVPLRTTRA